MLKGMARQKAPVVFKSGEPVSIICVASTFTGVTYANKGGNVQLTSTGVHELTTSPAVGVNVYVSWSDGSGINGLYSVLSVDSTTAITIDLVYVAGLGTPSVAIAGTEITLHRINIPSLLPNSIINLDISFSSTSSANNKDYKVKLNGVSLFALRLTTAIGGRCLTKTFNQGVTNSQVSSSSYAFPTHATGVTKTKIETSGQNNYISIVGQASATNQLIIMEYCWIEVCL